MATIGSAKATLVDKIDSLTASATAKDTIYLAKALKENTTHHSFTYLGAWAATTAYAVDDVVITGGQTYICILSHVAPGSFVVGAHWDLLASKGTNGSNGTDVGTGTAGQVLKTNSAGNAIEWGTDKGGAVLKAESSTYSTRVSMPTSSDHSIWSVAFTKLNDATTSYLRVTAQINGEGGYSDCAGVNCSVNNVNKGADEEAYFGVLFVQANPADGDIHLSVNKDFKVNALDVGTHTIRVGWKPRNGSSGERPFNILNPNSSDQARRHQSASWMCIEEIAY
jgi:hypothetical protein